MPLYIAPEPRGLALAPTAICILTSLLNFWTHDTCHCSYPFLGDGFDNRTVCEHETVLATPEQQPRPDTANDKPTEPWSEFYIYLPAIATMCTNLLAFLCGKLRAIIFAPGRTDDSVGRGGRVERGDRAGSSSQFGRIILHRANSNP